MHPGWISNFAYCSLIFTAAAFICYVAFGMDGVMAMVVGAAVTWAVEQD